LDLLAAFYFKRNGKLGMNDDVEMIAAVRQIARQVETSVETVQRELAVSQS
jgi:hypothetical protein